MKADLQKIVDPGLREFAMENDSDEQRSVIVEVDTPPIRLRPKPSKSMFAYFTPTFDFSDISDDGHIATSMDNLEERLLNIGLKNKPVRLQHAAAFVINATPEQLRAISQWPITGPIRSNRLHTAHR